MTHLNFFDLAALGDERLRRELETVWKAVEPPTEADINIYLRVHLGFRRLFTEEDRAHARDSIMYLRAEAELRRRLGWSEEEDPEDLAEAAGSAAATADKSGIATAQPANDRAPQLPVAAGTSRPDAGSATRRPGDIHVDLVDDEGNRFPVFRDGQSRICFMFGGRPPPAGVRLRMCNGETFDLECEDGGDHCRLGAGISLADILEGAEDGMIPVSFRR